MLEACRFYLYKMFNRGRQPFSCSHYFVGIIVQHVHESDIMHPITHKVLCTKQSSIMRKRGDLSNNTPQPPSCGYSDVTLTTSEEEITLYIFCGIIKEEKMSTV